MKKRLFISSILMTLVLLVAITTATFAWYQASVGTGITGTKSQQLSATSTTTVEAQDLTLDFTIEQTSAAGIVLTDGSANTKGWRNGEVFNGSKGSAELYGTYTITVAWNSGVTNAQRLNAVEQSAEATFVVSRAGNLKLIAANTDLTDATGIAETLTFKVQAYDNSGTPSLRLVQVASSSVTVAEGGASATGYFVIRTNNASGMEALADKGAFANGTFALGDVVKYTDNHYYICKVAHTATEWVAANWEDFGTEAPVLHSADLLSIAKQ